MMKKRRKNLTYIVMGVLIALIVLYVLFLSGTFTKDPVVEVTPDNCYGRTLRVVTDEDYRPYSFYDKNGSYSGYDVELITMIANDLGYDLDISFMSWPDAIGEAVSGNADILMTCDYTDEFDGSDTLIKSEPVSIDDFTVYSRKKIRSVDSLYGERIAALSEGNVSFHLDMLGLRKYCIMYDTNREAMEALASGEADYAVMRQSVGEVLLKEENMRGIKAYVSIGQSYICYGIRGSDPDLAKNVNRVIDELKSSGELERLREKWLTTFVRPYSFVEVLSNNLWIVLVFIILVAYMLITIFRNKQREISEHEEQEKRDLIMQDQLQNALSMAESANRAKTTFLSSMSHDIRTPMNAIVGFTELAEKHLDNPAQTKDYLRKIKQSSAHLLSLINDVLDMSRIESGKMRLEEKEEDLPEIIHAIRDIVQADIQSKQLRFQIDAIEVNDEHVSCDRLRLNQVLLNIISNSIKYTPAGGDISLHIIETPSEIPEHARYTFTLRDNGIGMSEEFMKTIFEPFTRVRSSTVSGIQGTGLGMAITKNIVDMMKGSIDIKSEEGKGTEVSVSFDFRVVGEEKSHVPLPELSDLRILVVDDDPDLCLALSKMLRDLGAREEWCTSGTEAVIRAKEALQTGDGFGVYFIDYLMPGLDGIETARKLGKTVGNGAKMIMLTSYDWADFEEEAVNAGITAFVNKPMFPSDLRRILMDTLGINETSAREGPVSYDFRGRRILLVEDNELNREIATEILEEYGLVIDTANDGTVAVEKIASAQPGDYDLILMDVQMPVMDGYEATRRILSLGTEISRIPIIAMTANAFEEDRRAALDAGMKDHISKPIDIKELVKILLKYL